MGLRPQGQIQDQVGEHFKFRSGKLLFETKGPGSDPTLDLFLDCE